MNQDEQHKQREEARKDEEGKGRKKNESWENLESQTNSRALRDARLKLSLLDGALRAVFTPQHFFWLFQSRFCIQSQDFSFD